MQIRLLAIPAFDPGTPEVEFNAVLAAWRWFVSDRPASFPALALLR